MEPFQASFQCLNSCRMNIVFFFQYSREFRASSLDSNSGIIPCNDSLLLKSLGKADISSV
jgi:hypothetical protein